MNFARVILLLKNQILPFSRIGKDYSHEQNNKITKWDVGEIGIFDHETALLEWTVCGPAIAHMFQDLPDIDEDDYYWFHHENIENFEKTLWN